MMFCNRYAGVASELIVEATARTYEEWAKRYGALPPECLRTEVSIKDVQNPATVGRCYELAGWGRGPVKRGKLFLFAPPGGRP